MDRPTWGSAAYDWGAFGFVEVISLQTVCASNNYKLETILIS